MTNELRDEMLEKVSGGTGGKVYYKVESDNCFGCAYCADACPVAAISDATTIARILKEYCTGCGACAPVCPTQCIYAVEE